jgi:hypothetical protein
MTQTNSAATGKKPFPLRKFAIIALLCAIIDNGLLLSPLQSPLTEFDFIWLLLGIVGDIMLGAACIIFSLRFRRSQNYNKNLSLSYSAARGGYKVIVFGIISLIAARIVEGLTVPPPSALSSQVSATLWQGIVSTVVGGIFVGFIVGYYFVRYSSHVPSSNPVIRAFVFSSLTVLVISGLGTLLNLNDPLNYFFWSVAYTIPAYSVFGLVLGYSYQRFDTEQSVRVIQARPLGRRTRLYFTAAFLSIAIIIAAASFYENSQIPASFTVSGIQISNNGGTLGVQAIINDTSQPNLIQTDVSIDGQHDGTCGYGFEQHWPVACTFTDPNDLQLTTCSGLPVEQTYSISFRTYFANSKIVYDTYSLTRAQLGCN